MKKDKFLNDSLLIADNHLKQARDEISEAAQTIYNELENLERLSSDCSNYEKIVVSIEKAMAALQFQDIVRQRLEKIEDFLHKIDTQVSINLPKSYLEEFRWENEVSQDDIDQFFAKGL